MQQSSEELNASAPNGGPTTLGDLKASGHLYRTVKQEIRENLLTRMRAGQERFPGIVGFDQTVLPHVERALIAGHDIILLGERGQGKTRLIRTLSELLDEWTPAVAGCEINDHPYAPVCARCRRLAGELGDELPVSWRHKSERYGEKLATPDTSGRRSSRSCAATFWAACASAVPSSPASSATRRRWYPRSRTPSSPGTT